VYRLSRAKFESKSFALELISKMIFYVLLALCLINSFDAIDFEMTRNWLNIIRSL